MSHIYSYGEWVDICNKGTNGDQVYDILESWKQDAYNLLEYTHKLEAKIEKLEAENARLSEMLHENNTDCNYYRPCL